MFSPRPPAKANGARASVQTHAAVDGELDAPHAAGRLGPPPDDPAQRARCEACLDPQRRLAGREVADEAQVLAPVPVPPRIAVVAGAAEPAARAGHLRVADQVRAVDRQQRAPREVRGQARRGPVLRLREARRVVRPALVLDPDRLGVDVPVAGVPRDVGEVDELHDPARAGDDEVRGGVRPPVPQPAHGAPEAALGDVDDDAADRTRASMRLRVVPLALEPGDRRPSERLRGVRARREPTAECGRGGEHERKQEAADAVHA